MSIEEAATKCEVCRAYINKEYNQFDVATRTKAMYDAAVEINEHFRKEHSRIPKQYAFTFTTNLSKEQIETDMLDACYRLYKQQTVPVAEGEAYLEYTKEGRPHIHGWYETEDGGRIFSKIFKRCWPTWGETQGKTQFTGGYHEQMKTNRYKGYAAAEDRVIIIKKRGEPLVYNAPPQSHSNSSTQDQ